MAPSQFSEVHFSIITLHTPVFTRGLFARVSPPETVCTLPRPLKYHMPPPSHHVLLDLIIRIFGQCTLQSSLCKCKNKKQQICSSKYLVSSVKQRGHLAPIVTGKSLNTAPGSLGQDRVVGIATGYGLDGPATGFRLGRDFPHPSRTILGPSRLLYNGYRLSYPRVNRPGRGVDHPPPSGTEVEGVELYIYIHLGLHGLF